MSVYWLVLVKVHNQRGNERDKKDKQADEWIQQRTNREYSNMEN
jgi:hypothetical protein